MHLHPLFLRLLDHGRGPFAHRRKTLLLDSRCLADEVSQVVQAGSAHQSATGHLYFINPRGTVGEGPFYTDAVADAPDREGTIGLEWLVLANDNALEVLQSLTTALNNLDAHANRISRPESRDIGVLLDVESLTWIDHDLPPGLTCN
jgi:hypothetical protein